MICRAINSWEACLADYRQAHVLKNSSQEQLAITARQLAAWCYRAGESATPGELSAEAACRFLHALAADGLAAKSLNRKRGDLLSLWRHAARRGWCAYPVAAEVVRFPEPRRLPDAWRQEELAALLAACRSFSPCRAIPGWDGRRDAALAMVLYDTAYRFSACLLLEKRQLTAEGAIVALAATQKTNRDECKWLGADTLAAVRETLSLPAARPELAGRLFPWPFRREAFWRHWKQLLTAAGLPATRRDGPQKMRRTSASWLEAERPGMARHHLAHATAGLAERHYIDPSIAYATRAVDALPRIGTTGPGYGAGSRSAASPSPGGVPSCAAGARGFVQESVGKGVA